jgi:hypothetical protein
LIIYPDAGHGALFQVPHSWRTPRCSWTHDFP